MAQYLDNEGAEYLAQKIQDTIQVAYEDNFDISAADRMNVYCVVERLPEFECMNLIALADGNITITIPANIDSTCATSISYSKDKSNWTETLVDNTAQTITIPVVTGDTVYLKGIANQWAISRDVFTAINSTANINVSGNIMSLLYGDDFEDNLSFPNINLTYIFSCLFRGNTHLIDAGHFGLIAPTLAPNCYAYMFYNCTSLTVAPKLPATTLANSCYNNTFYNCISLTVAPELPATTLAHQCYRDMFHGCTSLTTAPALPAPSAMSFGYTGMFQGCTSLTTAPALPATTLVHTCYTNMFDGCTSLTSAPELPATTLTNQCYSGMFRNCTSLTTAPELPATTLKTQCYASMFQGCSSLTSAPELPATTLADSCYESMFKGCSNLNNITMLAENISATNCLGNWVQNVAATGTFTKAAAMTTLPSGASGIPAGWTVQDYTE